MNKFRIFIMVIGLVYAYSLQGQNDQNLNWENTFESDWDKIDALIKEGKRGSAYDLAKSTFEKSLDKGNVTGVVKGLIAMTENFYYVNDEALYTIIAELENVVGDPVIKAFVDSYLAEMYQLYLEKNRYRISQNTEVGPEAEDWRLWNEKQFLSKIQRLYESSLEGEGVMNISSKKAHHFINGSENALYELRPAVFDLLIDRYVGFLTNVRLQSGLVPIYLRKDCLDQLLSFEISYCGNIDSAGNDGFQKTLEMFEKWENVHRRAGNTSALLSIIDQRLDYVINSVQNTRDSAHIDALDRLITKYPDDKYLTLLYFKKAQKFFAASEYTKAIEVIEEGLKLDSTHYYSFGIERLEQQKLQIQAKDLEVQVEYAYPIGQPPLFSINYRNIDKVHFDVFELNEEEFMDLAFFLKGKSSVQEVVSGKKPIWRDEIGLLSSDDYARHTTEWYIDQNLKSGRYLICYYFDDDSTKIKGTSIFQVSNIKLVDVSQNIGNKYFVQDRLTGKLITNAEVISKVIEDRRLLHKENNNLMVQSEGYYLMPDKNSNRRVAFKIRSGKDVFISPLSYQRSYVRHPAQQHSRTVFFTDRAVYQPGQTIFFKGLTVSSKELTSDLLVDKSVTVYLRDPNGREVWSKSYKTDEWGSITGEIPLPVTGLNGNWSLSSNWQGQHSVQVEAYTRPNFEIEFRDTNLKVSEKVISADGKVLTYGGFPIQKATGTAEIWLKKSRRWMYLSNDGDSEKLDVIPLVTDINGDFMFEFERVKKPELGHGDWSYYYYEVKVTIESPSGEIRIKEIQIPLKKDLMIVNLNLEERIDLEAEGELVISATNTFNRPAEFEGKMIIYELEVPEHFKVNRFWNTPDQRIIGKGEFGKKFGSYRFYDGDDGSEWQWEEKDNIWDSWPNKNRVSTQNLAFTGNSTVDLRSELPGRGYFRIEIISGEGDTVVSQNFYAYSRQSGFDLMHKAFEVIPDKDTYVPGDLMELKVLKNSNLANVILVFEGRDRKLQTRVLKGSKFEIKLSEKDRGGIQFIILGQLENRNFRESVFIDIPWKNKDLHILREDSISSIDVHTEKELSFSVKDVNGKGIQSEVAIAIYDASLDEYAVNNWNVDNVFFKQFNSYIPIVDLSGNLGLTVSHENNYWKRNNREIKEIVIPVLPPVSILAHRPMMMRGGDMMHEEIMVTGFVNMAKNSVPDAVEESESSDHDPKEEDIRQDFSENLIFAGKALTDSAGKIHFPITTNGKVGRWKVLVLAHDKELASGASSYEFTTKKDLYLEDYLPEYLRQGDAINLRFSVFNTTQNTVKGSLELEVKSLGNKGEALFTQLKKIDLNGRGSDVLDFLIAVNPDQGTPLVFDVSLVGEDGSIWDRMQKIVPVFQANETVHSGWVYVLEPGKKYELPDSLKSDLQGEMRIRVVRNMYSELLKSLPYLHNRSAKTTDQYLRNWMYANLGLKVAKDLPDFENIYNEWKRKGELEGRLSDQQDQKYEELSSTPWVRQNNTQEEQMALLSLYFDRNHMVRTIQTSYDQWTSNQNSDGGFPWLKGWPSDPYITGRILENIGKLMEHEIEYEKDDFDKIVGRAIDYYDSENFKLWKKWKQDTSGIDNQWYISPDFMRYFTTRAAFVKDHPIRGEHHEFWNSLLVEFKDSWAEKSFLDQAGIGIAAFHLGEKLWSEKIAEAFADNVIESEVLGAYWRYNHRSMQSNYLDLHSMGMELLQLNNIHLLDQKLLQWILVNKMTNDWSENPSVFHMILSAMGAGKNSFTTSNQVEIVNKKGGEFGEDHFTLSPEERLGFKVINRGESPVWVAVQISQEVALNEISEDSGTELDVEKLVVLPEERENIKMGDRLSIRLVLRADRDLDYVYLEDPLVPGVDEGISLSGFQWKNGLSYYQTFDFDKGQFFIRHLPKGTHIIEYELGVVRSGEFGLPRTKVQSYFVPEISGWDHWKALWEIGE
ncbi:MG2 domain-containing protein [Membranihabitans maritimus]|uniref:alpha-2-macroglobulin family protein n=1 Tax=Membranihabitans maritimus TaxID=2904244 RepID=UPI001F022D88|nr:MG2 domain-containing protein [Membranihabitans maritimus]